MRALGSATRPTLAAVILEGAAFFLLGRRQRRMKLRDAPVTVLLGEDGGEPHFQIELSALGGGVKRERASDPGHVFAPRRVNFTNLYGQRLRLGEVSLRLRSYLLRAADPPFIPAGPYDWQVGVGREQQHEAIEVLSAVHVGQPAEDLTRRILQVSGTPHRLPPGIHRHCHLGRYAGIREAARAALESSHGHDLCRRRRLSRDIRRGTTERFSLSLVG
jgi:hypothetical protein